MPINRSKGLSYFTFDNLSTLSWLTHGISTRAGGESVGDYAGLNISWLSGDRKNIVLANREKFFSLLGTKEEDVVETQQVHGNHASVVGEAEKGSFIVDTDAIITSSPGVSLLVKSGDCVLILLADPVKKVVAAVHAGWRGTVQEVARIAVEHMEDHFGGRAQDLIVGIGPSIGSCCYEVDTPVINSFKTFPYHKKLLSKIKGKHANLDLWEANRFQLVEKGVKPQNIEVAGICTYDNPDLFFSDRKIGTAGGRFGALISIK